MPAPHRSQTYTLIEPYEAAGRRIAHIDLYRLQGGQELDAIGVRDLIEPGAVLLVEWASRARHRLGPADLSLQIEYGQGATSRVLSARAGTPAGERLVAALRSSGNSELVVLSQ